MLVGHRLFSLVGTVNADATSLAGILVHSDAEDGASHADSKRYDAAQAARRFMPETTGQRASSSPSRSQDGTISSIDLDGSEVNDSDAKLLRLSAQSMEPLGPKQVRWSAVSCSRPPLLAVS